MIRACLQYLEGMHKIIVVDTATDQGGQTYVPGILAYEGKTFKMQRVKKNVVRYSEMTSEELEKFKVIETQHGPPTDLTPPPTG